MGGATSLPKNRGGVGSRSVQTFDESQTHNSGSAAPHGGSVTSGAGGGGGGAPAVSAAAANSGPVSGAIMPAASHSVIQTPLVNSYSQSVVVSAQPVSPATGAHTPLVNTAHPPDSLSVCARSHIIEAEPPTSIVQSVPQPAVGAPWAPAPVAAGPGGIQALPPQMLVPRFPHTSAPQPYTDNTQLAPGMVLVRSGSGQLLVIPQQLLAKMQAQTQAQAQAPGNISRQVAPSTIIRHGCPAPTSLAATKLPRPRRRRPILQRTVRAAVPGMTPRAVSQPAGTTVTSWDHSHSQETMENVKTCKDFLSRLVKMASNGTLSTEEAATVKELITELLEGKLEAEEFGSRISKAIKVSPQTQLAPFLQRHLQALRQVTPDSAAFIQQSQGPVSSTSPTPTAVVLGSPAPRPTAPISRPQLQPGVSKPGQNPSLVVQHQQQIAMLRAQVTVPSTLRNQAPGHIMLGQQHVQPVPVRPELSPVSRQVSAAALTLAQGNQLKEAGGTFKFPTGAHIPLVNTAHPPNSLSVCARSHIIEAEPPTSIIQSVPQPAVGAPWAPPPVAAGPGGIRALPPQMLVPRFPHTSAPQPYTDNTQLAPGMVLVRSGSGQLLVIPQQLLAKMQAQAQAQAQVGTAPRTATPTNVPPGPAPGNISRQVAPSTIIRHGCPAPTSLAATKLPRPRRRRPILQRTVRAAVPGMTPRAVSQPAGTTVTSWDHSHSQETMENVKTCKDYLSRLVKMASNGTLSTEEAATVKELITELLEGKLEAEEFGSRISKAINVSPQTQLAPFLQRHLQALRQVTPDSAAFIQQSQGPVSSTSPTPTAVVLGSPAPRPTAPISRPQLQPGVSKPGQNPSLVVQHQQQIAMLRAQVTVPSTLRNQAPGHIMLGQQHVQPVPVRPELSPVSRQVSAAALTLAQGNQLKEAGGTFKFPTGAHIPLVNTAHPPNSLSVCARSHIIEAEPPTSIVQSVPQPAVGAPWAPPPVAAGPSGIRALPPQMLVPRDVDDINDVTSMAGVNLSEESANILATNSGLVGAVTHSCEEEAFLSCAMLQRRMLEIGSRYGVTDLGAEVVNYVSHATQHRLKNLLEKVSRVAQQKYVNLKEDDDHEQGTDVRGQLKFFKQLDVMEKQRKEEQEREILRKAAKSRARPNDPEQLRLKQKAKEMQQQELAQMRLRQTNLTALAAIGPRKKRRNLDSPSSSAAAEGSGAGPSLSSGAGSSGSRPTRQRITRVNLRDLLFCLEEDRFASRSHLLYKGYLK